ncbi:lamin tail domain-containing protein [Haloferula chungangensis]|uniref:Lamin tail domain-containing protein n=1 Tax=Haloferula chungangensis TaxID=1048331 RepID=A0ABW2L853_9BACT
MKPWKTSRLPAAEFVLATLCLLPAMPNLATAEVRITEFLASNDEGLKDEDGERSDWIEIHNSGASSVDLDGWKLTDNSSNLGKWSFPSINIPSNGRILVFASGKDRGLPGLPLHTNFSLSKNGEYLALIKSDGTTIATEFSPSYPIQANDVSFGHAEGVTSETVVSLETPASVGIPSHLSQFNSQFTGWNTHINGAFNGSAWSPITLGVGYETDNGSYGKLIGSGGDIEEKMFMVNASAFIRIPFHVADVGEVTAASLTMRWDDGFTAYLNGQVIASDRAPTTASWNSTSTDYRNDALNSEQIQFHIDLKTSPLVEGLNLLAIQGFNQASNSSDFLIQPELVLSRTTGITNDLVYFPTPTPGTANGLGENALAPIFGEVTDRAPQPPTGNAESPPLTLTAEVRDGTHRIESVRVFHRRMFAEEISIVMKDDGMGVDSVANDKIFSAAIPTSQIEEGEMLRWRFETYDVSGNSRSSPSFLDPLDSDKYYGTVATDPDIATANLPVIQTFVEDEVAVDTRAGGRVSLYYLGRFYDNIQMDLHGQSTAGPSFPKKSHDLDFNNGNRFTWKEGEAKVKDVNFLTNFADKSRIRNSLTYELYQLTGAGYHFAVPVRVERNGQFHGVMDMVEDGDDRFLERLGLDPEGSLYKIYDRLVDPNASAKKTRKEEGTQDLQDFIDSLSSSLSLTQLRRNAYDNIDIAATINHLVANQIIAVSDTGPKNYYLYRDTEGSGEWRPLPWDVDLSMGRRWTADHQYFDDQLYVNYTTYNNNPLFTLINTAPEFKEMFVRRFESLRRQIFQSASPPQANDWFRSKVIASESAINPPGTTSDIDLDFAKWGSWGDNLWSTGSAARIYNEWLPRHRKLIFGDDKLLGLSIPSTQPAAPDIVISSVDENPASGSQEEEYVIIRNNSGDTVDLSGWTLSGAIEYTFPAGSVILAGNGQSVSNYRGLIHVARNSAAFRARSSGPKGNEFRYVQGPYSGQLSARGETLTLRNEAGAFIDDFTITPNPTPAQQYLRVSEIQYHPSNPTPGELSVDPALDDSDFEFIELINIGPSSLVLDGASFIEGIDFTFPTGITLASGSRIVVANNPSALAIRYPSIPVPVLGPFLGQLDNAGERLQLIDKVGENILDFEYSDDWYPPSDGEGASLVLRDTSIPYNDFDKPSSWGSSPEGAGSPGEPGTGYLIHFNGWQAEHYQAAAQLPGQPGHPDADDDNDGWSLWYEYALGMDPDVFDPPLFKPETIGSGSSAKFGIRYSRRPRTSDVNIELLASGNLTRPTPLDHAVEADLQSVSPDRESLLLHDPSSMSSAPSKFYHLRIRPDASDP